MAGPLLQPLLLLLLSLALGSAEPAAHGNGERIISGFRCPRGAQPWQVALLSNHKIKCSGVLIHRKWVLTVAHCHRSEYVVQMGSDLLVDPNAQRIRATESFIHPEFDAVRKVHDIMLVKLSSPATLSSTVRTVDVPSECKPAGTSCTVSGWGSNTTHGGRNTSQLMCIKTSILSKKECKKFYPNMQKRFMLCAAPPNRRSSVGKGDSGGPLMCEGSLQGLVSKGDLSPRPPFLPTIYTRMCGYHKWISDTMTGNA